MSVCLGLKIYIFHTFYDCGDEFGEEGKALRDFSIRRDEDIKVRQLTKIRDDIGISHSNILYIFG